MYPFDYERWLLVVAHYDDEALLFGDLLLELREREKQVMIAVLTDVAQCNPPEPGFAPLREAGRQACRLGAFARVCMAVNARAVDIGLPQLAWVPEKERAGIEAEAATLLADIVRGFSPDVVVTHGLDGEYESDSVPGEQHRWAARLCQAAGVPSWVRDPAGVIQVPRHPDAKNALLYYYRYGCTQTPEWDPNVGYREFVDGPERFTAI